MLVALVRAVQSRLWLGAGASAGRDEGGEGEQILDLTLLLHAGLLPVPPRRRARTIKGNDKFSSGQPPRPQHGEKGER